MWRVSRPHIAEVGRVDGTEHFRNVKRHEVSTHPHVVAVRFDASFNFANAPYFEAYLLGLAADREGLKKILLIASGINDIDATGIETLQTIRQELQSAEIEFYMSDVKGPVSDRLRAAAFDSAFLEHQIFLSADTAFKTLAQRDVCQRDECQLQPTAGVPA